MLDRKLIQEFLQEKELNIPANLNIEQISEIFCQYTEDSFFDWLNDSFQTFFNQNEPDWEWIKKTAGERKISLNKDL
jgi:hypothetical protein